MIRRYSHSLGLRLGALSIAFIAVPAILANQFLHAEAAKRATLLRTVQAEGQLIAEGLRIAITRGGRPPSVVEMRNLVERIDARGINMRLLLRPTGDPTSVYLIAASPAVPADQLEAERANLLEAGIVAQFPTACDGAAPLNLHYTGAGHDEEVLSSITPFAGSSGCWAIVTSHASSDAVGSLLGRPYWQAPEVELAAGIYGLLAVVAIALFGGLWRALVLFGRKARRIGTGQGAASFAEGNRIPELSGVAEEFDRMVKALHGSAEAVRRAAEDNAHALKNPIATIAQSLDAVRRGLAEDDERGRRSLYLIEQSTMRLDALVTAARQMDEANASLVNPPHERVDLSSLVTSLLGTYEQDNVRLAGKIAPGCHVSAGSELLETVVENILENAISFSPEGGQVIVTLARDGGRVVLSVEDEGPGATADLLATMFDRYVSCRPEVGTGPGEQHFGIGLWLVRRNVESVGGLVHAENRAAGGLSMVVSLPMAR